MPELDPMPYAQIEAEVRTVNDVSFRRATGVRSAHRAEGFEFFPRYGFDMDEIHYLTLRCPTCHGTGSIEYDRGDDCWPAVVTCERCNGTGVARQLPPASLTKVTFTDGHEEWWKPFPDIYARR